MRTKGFDIPEEINIHKLTWGKNPEEVIYGRGKVAKDDDDLSLP
jgi:hypothetical protein